MKRSASEATWKSADPDAELAELIKQVINALKDNNEAVQKMNDSVAKLQVIVESNTKRLDDITAKINAIDQNIEKLNAASTTPIRLPSPSTPMELDHVVANAAHGVSSDGNRLDHGMEGMTRSEVTFRHKVYNISKLKESQLSPPCTVRNLPWKIMVMPKSTLTEEGQSQKSLGFFLQCNGESESTTWSCSAVAELRLLSVKGQKPFGRKVLFLYDTKKRVSGFSHFMLWNDVLDPDKGYIKDNAITLEVHIVADAPQGLSYEMEIRGVMARSEATFRYTVENISEMKEWQLSPPCIVRNLPWKIKVKSSLTEEEKPRRSLGFFLQCNSVSNSTTWSCYAVAELRLLSVKKGQEPYSEKFQHIFYPEESDWGYPSFMLWNDVLNPDKGYINDDAITLEVHVVADAPYGVD